MSDETAPSWESRLTPRQRLFVREFLVDRIATKAALRAGYTSQSGQDFLSRPKYRKLQEALRQALQEDEGRHADLRERIIAERCRVAFSDVGDLVDAAGDAVALEDLPPELRSAIAEWKETEFLGQDGVPQKVRKIKLWSKNEALTALEKITGLTRERVEHSGSVNVTAAKEELNAILDRLGSPSSLSGGAGGAGSEVEGGAPPVAD